MAIDFVYLDEFGHDGPFVSRFDSKFRESPVFGLAGIILPETAVRPFATKFLHLKEYMFGAEIKKSGKLSSLWEKHGTNIYTAKALRQYPEVRQGAFRLLNYVRGCGGKIFYYGREKKVGVEGGNSNGLRKTTLGYAIRQLDEYATQANRNFIIVADEHSSRKEMLVTATKTMYGTNPTRHLISPPFEVESYVNQNIQAADWVASIVGRLWAYELKPDEYQDYSHVKDYLWDRIHQVATHSTVWRRRTQTPATQSAALVTPKEPIELKIIK